jgi:hypothetical protein
VESEAVQLFIGLSLVPLWLTPFLYTSATRPLAVWTVTVLATYVILSLERVHGPWGLPWWLVAAEYGAVRAAAMIGLRVNRQEAFSQVCVRWKIPRCPRTFSLPCSTHTVAL